jgi:predicted homoserine dehydrogenase-like protein
MSLHRQLQELAANNQSIKVGLIGAGKFGSMYLSQIPTTPGVFSWWVLLICLRLGLRRI